MGASGENAGGRLFGMLMTQRVFKILALAALLLIPAAAAVLAGAAHIAPHRVVQILTGSWQIDPRAMAWDEVIILEIRLPRLILAAAVGSSLALCGAAMQGMFRNPLACPSITGVSSGAALGAVAAIFFGLSAFSFWTLPVLAFGGGLLSSFAVYVLAARRGEVSTSMLLLSGIALNSINGALSAFLLSLSFAGYETGKQIVFWTLGGLEQPSWPAVIPILPLIVLGCAVMLFYSRDLDALSLGELHAASVGVDVGSVRRRLMAAASLVTAAGVSLCGPLGFIGLIIPHIVRLIVGPHHRRLFPASMLGGAVFLTAADVFARTIIAPEEIRLGIVTAACGGPFFLYLLLTRGREAVYG